MIVNTGRLFCSLLSSMQIDVICDIGSMDGAEALRFSNAVPGATVWAFEPNPRNFSAMASDPALGARDIRLSPLAVTDFGGVAAFFLVGRPSCDDLNVRGMSSLSPRVGEFAPSTTVQVQTTRLDTFLADQTASHTRIALWIDTEGSAYEVLRGAAGLAEKIQLLHVEVETAPCIAAHQKLYPEVRTLLGELGFVQVATDAATTKVQFNALFVRRPASIWLRLRLTQCLARSGLRSMIGRFMHRVCPICTRRYLARHSQRDSRCID